MRRADGVHFCVVSAHVISLCIFSVSGVLKHLGMFELREFFDGPRVVFVITAPSILYTFAACFGVCLLLLLKTRSATPVFLSAGVHGAWALYCTRLLFIGWISQGTQLTILLYWSATLALAWRGVVILRTQRATEPPVPPDAEGRGALGAGEP